jgi:hypothetical protein
MLGKYAQLFVGILIGIFIVIFLMATGLLDAMLGNGGPVNNEWGQFIGSPRTEWLDDENGRLMRLTEDFGFRDKRGKIWTSESGSIINGASIPQAIWSITGGPYEGKHRNASIVHDTACDEKTGTWQEVHTMFYEGCRCSGVPEVKAKILFWAVYHGGPRWKFAYQTKMREEKTPDGKIIRVPVIFGVAIEDEPGMTISDEKAKRIQKLIEDKNPSIEDLMKLENP